MALTAKIFKVETFGAVDGPGVRLVIFMQGCTFRCKYCHNPEGWNLDQSDANETTVEQVIGLYESNKPFYKKGGITLSGGEPMLQADFIKLLAKECKAKNIHLTVDTSACNFMQNKAAYESLIDDVDLWLVDIKSLEANQHQLLTGSSELTGVEFVKYLESKNKPYWVRQVIVKGFNDDKAHLDALANFVKTLKCCQRHELLSYHNLAKEKYERLGIEYPFAEVPVLAKEEFDKIIAYFKEQVSK